MGTSVKIGNRSLLLFDGVCNLCNNAVHFIIDRDSQQRFVFASLQSKLGRQMAQKYQLPETDFKSIVLVKENMVFVKSAAVLEVVRELSGNWNLLYVFKIVPEFLRNWIYEIISANRYKWFGRQDQCSTFSADMKNRFVSF